jgi:hypothetical protein
MLPQGYSETGRYRAIAPPEFGLGDLGLVDDSAENIMARLDSVRVDMITKYKALSRMLGIWISAAAIPSWIASINATLLTPWKRDATWVDAADGMRKYQAKVTEKVNAWYSQYPVWKTFDPKDPAQLLTLQAFLKQGKAIVDAMDLAESTFSLTSKDAVTFILGGPLLVWYKRMAQIVVSLLRRPAAAISNVAVAGGKVAVDTAKFIGTTAVTTVQSAAGLMTFVSKYGVAILAVGAALYFLAPVLAPAIGSSIRGYKAGRR